MDELNELKMVVTTSSTMTIQSQHIVAGVVYSSRLCQSLPEKKALSVISSFVIAHSKFFFTREKRTKVVTVGSLLPVITMFRINLRNITLFFSLFLRNILGLNSQDHIPNRIRKLLFLDHFLLFFSNILKFFKQIKREN